jgi:hypothetical protein
MDKYRLSLATLFKNTILARYDENGEIYKYILIPLIFSQNSKVYDIANGTHLKNAMNSINEVDVAYPLPSMSITFDDLTPNPEGNFNQNYLVEKEKSIYTPSNFLTSFRLNIISKSTSDTDQIIEQIIPLFKDSGAVTCNLTDTVKHEMIVELESITLDYPEEFQMEDLGLIESSINFNTDVSIFRFPRELPTNLTVEMGIIAKNGNDTMTIIDNLL